MSAFYPAEDGHSLLSNLHIVLRCRSAVCHTATLLELEMNLCEVLQSQRKPYARQALDVKRQKEDIKLGSPSRSLPRDCETLIFANIGLQLYTLRRYT